MKHLALVNFAEAMKQNLSENPDSLQGRTRRAVPVRTTKGNVQAPIAAHRPMKDRFWRPEWWEFRQAVEFQESIDLMPHLEENDVRCYLGGRSFSFFLFLRKIRHEEGLSGKRKED